MSESNKALHKEFELERLILFSDAVFAIAITLLIIEIKFPDVPEGTKGLELFKLFSHTIIQFVTFILSFIIIGLYWARHLQLCRYLKTYDTRLIIHNLFFLFFVVTFPFTASGIGHFSPHFHIPMHLYMINLFCLAGAYYLFADYALHKNKSLSHAGNEEEKKYLIVKTKYPVFMLGCSLIVVLLVYFTNDNKSNNIIYSYQSITVFAVIMAIMLKRYKRKMKN